jgi:hypothetical protein
MDHRHTYDPEPIFAYIQNNNEPIQPGLYLSVVSVESPTMDGKRWFIQTGYADDDGYDSSQSREVSWRDAKKLQFWNGPFRSYVNLHQARGIQDYTVYVSRCFGYTWITGLTVDPDDEELPLEFTTFYPSLHHYHNAVAVNENNFWRGFDQSREWTPRTYQASEPVLETDIEESDDIQPTLDEAVQIMGEAVEGVTMSTERWSAAAGGLDLADILSENDDQQDIEED